MDYTKDYKKKKVEEYLNSKLSLRKFTKTNNIPKTTFQGWIQTYNEYGSDAFMDSNKRNTLTLQERHNLVELYLRNGDDTLTKFAKSHGIPAMTFSAWVHKYYQTLLPEYIRREGQDLSKDKKTNNKYNNIKEIEELKRKLEEKDEQLLRLEIENAYLKELRRIRLQEKMKKKQGLPKTSEDNTH